LPARGRRGEHGVVPCEVKTAAFLRPWMDRPGCCQPFLVNQRHVFLNHTATALDTLGTKANTWGQNHDGRDRERTKQNFHGDRLPPLTNAAVSRSPGPFHICQTRCLHIIECLLPPLGLAFRGRVITTDEHHPQRGHDD
jgi:hypothetical protein